MIIHNEREYYSIEDCMARLNRSQQATYKTLRRKGVDGMPLKINGEHRKKYYLKDLVDRIKPLDAINEIELKRLLMTGLSKVEIAKQLKTNVGRISYALDKLGIKLRPAPARKRLYIPSATDKLINQAFRGYQ